MQEMRFSSNKGQRLAFEDMNAMAKCELFSRKGNTSFPPDVKCSLLPNLDILGAPIGDYLHCSKFIAGKCAESRKLLSGLVDVAAVDLQVAVTLLRMCGSFCRMVHIARSHHPAWPQIL